MTIRLKRLTRACTRTSARAGPVRTALAEVSCQIRHTVGRSIRRPAVVIGRRAAGAVRHSSAGPVIAATRLVADSGGCSATSSVRAPEQDVTRADMRAVVQRKSCRSQCKPALAPRLNPNRSASAGRSICDRIAQAHCCRRADRSGSARVERTGRRGRSIAPGRRRRCGASRRGPWRAPLGALEQRQHEASRARRSAAP